MPAVLQRCEGRLTATDGSTSAPFGILLGSAVNQAGRSSGLTAPNGPSQSALISTALAAAGISSLDVRFVSVHGTGTALGDPIEVGALASALPAQSQQQPFTSGSSSPLTLASNKSCYGHTEGAAGLTGLLLAACMAGQQVAPAIMHLRTINPYVAAALADWSAQSSKTLHLPRQLASGASAGQGVAGTSSFGMSGVNAHMLVRAAPQGTQVAVPTLVSVFAWLACMACAAWLAARSQWPADITVPCPTCRRACLLNVPVTSVPQLCIPCCSRPTPAMLAAPRSSAT